VTELNGVDDDPLRSFVAGRRIEANPASEATIRRASAWLEQCRADHEEGRGAAVETLLPPKVLDVESTALGGVSFYTSSGEKRKYAALSHVRDTDYPDNNDVDLENLPKTFQDAVIMTRELGLQYLWIDTLW
jgi:hypothetical protein